MAVFQYSGFDLASSRQRGTIVADTPRAARDLLRERGMTVEQIQPHESRANPFFSRGRRFDHKTISLIRELATLIGVGIPLLEALDGIARQHRGSYHAVLLTLRDRIAAGASLTDAMKEQPDVFDEFCINLTEVGESAGT